MSIELDATYENGTLKLDRLLPLAEHLRVRVVVETQATIVERDFGIIGWTGDAETVRKIALGSEWGVQEAP